jgi:arginine deiminase
MTTEKVKYGVHSEAGKLRKVMVCSRPGPPALTPNNCDELLFDDVLWVARPSATTSTSSPRCERGVDVLEMHNLLTDIVAIPKHWTGSSSARSPPIRSAWA